MSMLFVTPDGGLTAFGYFASASAGIVLFLAGGLIPKSQKKRLSARQLAFCGAAMALAFVTSYIRLFSLPYGGSVTLFSTLFICLIGHWYGPSAGITTGLAYGILQFLQEPFVLSPFQVCCDYVLAFAALGLSGVFAHSKNGLVKGYLLGSLVRGLFHTIGGYLYWMEYMPEEFPQALTAFYPIIYNYSYILTEGALAVLVVTVPPVKKALEEVKRMAVASSV